MSLRICRRRFVQESGVQTSPGGLVRLVFVKEYARTTKPQELTTSASAAVMMASEMNLLDRMETSRSAAVGGTRQAVPVNGARSVAPCAAGSPDLPECSNNTCRGRN